MRKRSHHQSRGVPAFTQPRGVDTLASLARQCGEIVYFIRCDDGLIKIGHTGNLAERRKHFGSGWDRVLALQPGTRADEKAVHSLFAKHLERGREYFRPDPEVLAYINKIRARLGVTEI